MSIQSISHEFKSHTFKKPTWCAQCGQFLWGFYHQGKECKGCLAPTHDQCAAQYDEKHPCSKEKGKYYKAEKVDTPKEGKGNSKIEFTTVLPQEAYLAYGAELHFYHSEDVVKSQIRQRAQSMLANATIELKHTPPKWEVFEPQDVSSEFPQVLARAQEGKAPVAAADCYFGDERFGYHFSPSETVHVQFYFQQVSQRPLEVQAKKIPFFDDSKAPLAYINRFSQNGFQLGCVVRYPGLSSQTLVAFFWRETSSSTFLPSNSTRNLPAPIINEDIAQVLETGDKYIFRCFEVLVELKIQKGKVTRSFHNDIRPNIEKVITQSGYRPVSIFVLPPSFESVGAQTKEVKSVFQYLEYWVIFEKTPLKEVKCALMQGIVHVDAKNPLGSFDFLHQLEFMGKATWKPCGIVFDPTSGPELKEFSKDGLVPYLLVFTRGGK